MRPIHIVDISWSGSLYEPSSDLLLSKLENAIDSRSPGEIVVLRANADCHDYSYSWQSYLKDEAIWRELVCRLNRWHELFAKIAFSKSKWFFLASGDVVGSWWELAIACHGRVLANPYAKVGFPEVYLDMFPPLGALGLKHFSAYESATTLKKNAILHAREAYKAKVVDLCLLSDLWIYSDGVEQLRAWFERFRAEGLVKFIQKSYPHEIPSLHDLEAKRLDAATRRAWLMEVRIDAATSSLRDRNQSHRAAALAYMRAAAAGRYLFSDYRAWLSRRVTRYRLGTHDRWWTTGSDVIVVNVTEGLPPQDVVTALLLRRKRLVFSATNSVKLRVALETMRGRFNRTNDQERDAFDLWDRWVHWVCAPLPEHSGIMSCTFYENDLVDIKCGQYARRYFRISGNYGTAGIGWYEQVHSYDSPSDQHPEVIEDIAETVSLIANGVLAPYVDVAKTGDQTPLSVALRYLLLEYLLRLGERMGRYEALTDLLKTVASGGWGFAADPYQWSNLLKHYPPMRVLMDRFSTLFSSDTANWRVLTLNDIQQARLNHKHTTAGEELDIRSGAMITRLLAALGTQVSDWLVKQRLVASADEADLFVSLAWGYPGNLPLPSMLVREAGMERVHSWLDVTACIHTGPTPARS